MVWVVLAATVANAGWVLVAEPSYRTWHHPALAAVSVQASALMLSRLYGRAGRIALDLVAMSSAAVCLWTLRGYLAGAEAGFSAAELGLAVFVAMLFGGLAAWMHATAWVKRSAR